MREGISEAWWKSWPGVLIRVLMSGEPHGLLAPCRPLSLVLTKELETFLPLNVTRPECRNIS